MPKLKICGMRDRENIIEVARLRPDMMGFIFFPESARFVGPDFKIPEQLPVEIERVGVFVDEDLGRMLDLVKEHRLDFVQLHGYEQPQVCRELKEHNVQIIKAFPVDTSFDFEVPKFYLDSVDYFLFDTKGASPGGNGRVFDWALLDRYKLNKPFFLSGGLSPENIPGAMGVPHEELFAFDLNSGLETRPGVKSTQLIERLNEILKRN